MSPEGFDAQAVARYWFVEAEEALIRITAFNIEARYPDPKGDFRRKCTREYAIEQIAGIQEVLAWLKSRRMS
jgi:hypothetical protein